MLGCRHSKEYIFSRFYSVVKGRSYFLRWSYYTSSSFRCQEHSCTFLKKVLRDLDHLQVPLGIQSVVSLVHGALKMVMEVSRKDIVNLTNKLAIICGILRHLRFLSFVLFVCRRTHFRLRVIMYYDIYTAASDNYTILDFLSQSSLILSNIISTVICFMQLWLY